LCHRTLGNDAKPAMQQESAEETEAMAVRETQSNFGALPVEVLYQITGYLNRYELRLPTSDTPPTALKKLRAAVNSQAKEINNDTK
jgi:hypothetical protein